MKMEFVPKWIAWEVTRRCNLSCVHCRSASTTNSFDTAFNTEEAKSLIDDISSFSSPVIVLSGGEPLLRADLFEIAGYGTGKGLRMCIATNGSLVTDEICLKMKAAGIRMVSMSLDGANPETHDDFRGQPGAFDGVVRAAGLFNKHGIEFLINSSFTKRNQKQIPEVMKVAKGLGAKAWYMFMIVPTGRGEEIMAELITKEDYEDILKWHYETEKDEDEMLMRPTCAPHYYRIVPQMNKLAEEGDKLERRTLKFSTGGSKGCLAGQVICLITAEGDVFPCSYFPRSAGNVKETPFKDIWEKSQLFEELRDFKKYKGKCGQCEYINVCGGCRARADAVYGDYLEEEPFCNYTPIKMQKKAK
ncbi:MAG: radical SAM protein [Nitrospirae bacterium]|nr:radical SAM protein [Nitrospirota bacterium]